MFHTSLHCDKAAFSGCCASIILSLGIMGREGPSWMVRLSPCPRHSQYRGAVPMVSEGGGGEGCCAQHALPGRWDALSPGRIVLLGSPPGHRPDNVRGAKRGSLGFGHRALSAGWGGRGAGCSNTEEMPDEQLLKA